ncbi:BT4734/BF3469 family protein [Plebeiibacterium sediminum]|uniref:BT4734-like N-terminal domain-containing protein n=1 Tax=Plebeiibacterium sediminum TaxID=2992112 RepID=A0AAE3SDJ7_9BACT|nr:BT4734/BF3469 family protein [Plebeiobacterium sediminum]MCW3785488.1 hypothetical protein [Plebeiobacterium sediminum]
MELDEQAILDKTNYGLNIYSHILRVYYPNEVVLRLSGKQCSPAKNPFNKNKLTLKLINVDWVFLYSDLEKDDFKGNPFEFAALHYKLTGNELLEKLNEEMHLRIGEQWDFYGNKNLPELPEEEENKPAIHIPKFSYFNSPVSNIYPKSTVSLVEVYELIKSTKNTSKTEQLRTIQAKDEARKFKASKFDYVTFSGVFTKRNDKALQNHSGLLTIDFDYIENLQQLKNQLLNDEYFETELLFVSPSGDGLKWIIPIDITESTHQNFFNAIANYIKEVYQLKVDKSGKDVSRACFLPSDPEVFINPKYL